MTENALSSRAYRLYEASYERVKEKRSVIAVL